MIKIFIEGGGGVEMVDGVGVNSERYLSLGHKEIFYCTLDTTDHQLKISPTPIFTFCFPKLQMRGTLYRTVFAQNRPKREKQREHSIN